MPEYRRAHQPGGTFFLTMVTDRRRPILVESRRLLRSAIERTRAVRPFRTVAVVLLPDHLHCVWTLPPGDSGFAARWQAIKARFSLGYLRAGGSETRRSASRVIRGERGVWQRRYWERQVRDEDEFERLCAYIHYNPVKHGRAACPHAWPWSSFAEFVRAGRYPPDWNCTCRGAAPTVNDESGLDGIVGE
jgi:putative transposase